MSTNDQHNVRGWIGAGCLFALIVADMTYGAINGRESLVTWIQILLGALALFSLFSHRISEFRISKTGFTIKQPVEVAAENAANLGAAAVVHKVKTGAELSQIEQSIANQSRQIARSVAQAAEAGAAGRLAGKRVLWVDDQPHNNEHGINALKAQGVEVTTSRTTREALEEVKKREFDVIITDQHRKEDEIEKKTAGDELLRALQDNGVKAPVILSTAFPDREKAWSYGFYDATNTQHGVFELVMKAIQEA